MTCRLLLLSALLLSAPGAALAQTGAPAAATGQQMTRAQLEELLRTTEQQASRDQQAVTQAALLRQRLSEGDLQVGDRIALYVAGFPQMSDTFPVSMGRVVVVPEVGEIPLQGVLRSELQTHLTKQIGRVIRDPVVRVQPLIRFEVRGAVGKPGFYTMAADMLLSDVVMAAGGPVRDSGLDRMRIIRGSTTLWSSNEMRSALVEGLTLDQLNVQAGDRIEVPTQRTTATTARTVIAVVSGVASLFYLIQRVR